MKLVKQRITRATRRRQTRIQCTVPSSGSGSHVGVQIRIKSNINICIKAARWRCRTVIRHTVELNSVRVADDWSRNNSFLEMAVAFVQYYYFCCACRAAQPRQPSNGERRRPPCRKYNTCATRSSLRNAHLMFSSSNPLYFWWWYAMGLINFLRRQTQLKNIRSFSRTRLAQRNRFGSFNGSTLTCTFIKHVYDVCF